MSASIETVPVTTVGELLTRLAPFMEEARFTTPLLVTYQLTDGEGRLTIREVAS